MLFRTVELADMVSREPCRATKRCLPADLFTVLAILQNNIVGNAPQYLCGFDRILFPNGFDKHRLNRLTSEGDSACEIRISEANDRSSAAQVERFFLLYLGCESDKEITGTINETRRARRFVRHNRNEMLAPGP
jgi:hypothetical protein